MPKNTKLTMVIIAIALISCAMQKVQQPVNLTQGVEGYIYQVTGNQMPMKGKPRSKGKGVVREVYIFAATTAADAKGAIPLFDQISSKLITQVKSDTAGHYQAQLPTGTYSVLVKENGKYFASETDGQGVLTPAEVTTGKVIRRDVTVNVGAAY